MGKEAKLYQVRLLGDIIEEFGMSIEGQPRRSDRLHAHHHLRHQNCETMNKARAWLDKRRVDYASMTTRPPASTASG